MSVTARRRLLTFTVLLVLYNEVFGGVFRWAFNTISVPLLSYLPAVLALISIAVILLLTGFRSRYDIRVCLVVSFFLAYAAYGYAMGGGIASTAYALWTWVPFFLGILATRFGIQPQIRRHLYFLLLASVIGVFVTAAVTVPWMGTQGFQVGGLDVSATKDWKAGELVRLPGFSRASTSAADDIVILLLWILWTRPKWLILLALWATSIYAVVLTTSKTPLFTLALAPPTILVYSGLATFGKRQKTVLKMYGSVCIVCLLAIMVTLPYLDLDHASDRHLPLEDVLPFMTIDSFVDRMQNTWPNAFALISSDKNPSVESVFGRGIGGIGNGQMLSEKASYNAADNMHVFLYVTFGVFSCLFYAAILTGQRSLLARNSNLALFQFSTAIGVLGLGTLTGVIEGTTPAFALGTLISFAISPKQRIRPAQVETARERPAGSLHAESRPEGPSAKLNR